VRLTDSLERSRGGHFGEARDEVLLLSAASQDRGSGSPDSPLIVAKIGHTQRDLPTHRPCVLLACGRARFFLFKIDGAEVRTGARLAGFELRAPVSNGQMVEWECVCSCNPTRRQSLGV
jgi:hypothetical protein